eukprot:m.95190 g.95190  ORF g.95190 m.95190 type:complete len:124 (-) comp8593_c0_seq4:1468-1839(-)
MVCKAVNDLQDDDMSDESGEGGDDQGEAGEEEEEEGDESDDAAEAVDGKSSSAHDHKHPDKDKAAQAPAASYGGICHVCLRAVSAIDDDDMQQCDSCGIAVGRSTTCSGSRAGAHGLLRQRPC